MNRGRVCDAYPAPFHDGCLRTLVDGMAKLAIFIDGGYLTNIARPLRIWVDFEKLSNAIRDKLSASIEEPLDLLRTYYYDCLPWRGEHSTDEENKRYFATQNFFKRLRDIPRFDVREGRLQYLGEDGNGRPIVKQKRVDLLIGMDMARLCLRGRVSHVALLSGDSDFLPVLDVAKEEGVAVWHLHGDRNTYAEELRRTADDTLHLDRAFLQSIRRERT